MWEATSSQYLARENVGVKMTSIEASGDGSKVYIGSLGGAVRVYDVTNWCMPWLIKIIRFSNKPITTLIESSNHEYLAIAAEGDWHFWIMKT